MSPASRRCVATDALLMRTGPEQNAGIAAVECFLPAGFADSRLRRGTHQQSVT